MVTSSPPEQVPQNSDLQVLADTRAALTFRLSALVLALFLPLPILGGFTSLLDGVVFSGVTVAWLYAVAQFVVAIVVARYYMARAAELDSRTASRAKG
ncbi:MULTISPECIES: DUF485 domain-containing protein [Rhodococcus]|jgi:uncharacterized membrane protein (DUF485 family)|uniref:DUF485 domain-containing protein n=4 Tax=Rhodococcus TaxID=1827 RepID=Q0SCT3_RHOJR|nr:MULTISPECIES: DUF485 domain-containing protein [Rhodococcus]ELB86151.1 hypothetical protein Rwratislav_46495 [Rhodococcus wratislaviensis IFP 2016]ABG94653.1 conserved hypothetical protein [Rhodococcus jostii RHA1]EJI99122.1 hypothetical protein JVH1_3560 [Rhodococcus sp. JVH1]EKT82433.1 hypothetical protein WSS_A12143 [Rhodococcus opacus M213]MCQ4118901.1 DUF485 domain-containing protein [Rhodococcus sp. FXJ9.536]